MEQISGGQSKQSSGQNNEGFLPITDQLKKTEGHYFFAKEGKHLEKIYLVPATNRKLETNGAIETEEEYKERMRKIVNLIISEDLPTAVEALAVHLRKKINERDPNDLIPVIQIQNKVIRTLSGLSRETRGEWLSVLKKAWRRIGSENYPSWLAERMKSAFDGVHFVCRHMETEREKLGEGEEIEFFTNDSLDALHEVDLVAVVKKKDEKCVVRLIQCKSSTNEENIPSLQDKHSSPHETWVKKHLLGIHELTNDVFKLFKVELGSHRGGGKPRHVDILREVVVNDAKQAQDMNFKDAVDVRAKEILNVLRYLDTYHEKITNLPVPFRGASPLTLCLVVLCLLEQQHDEDAMKKIIDLLRKGKKEQPPALVFGYPIERFESVIVVGDTSYKPVAISSDARYIVGVENIVVAERKKQENQSQGLTKY